MKPEKKTLELKDNEKVIFELMKSAERMELGTLKAAAELSGKQWDKGMKALSKLGILKVEVDGDAKVVVLN
jgi:lysyl-tRNA synthetase class 2